MLIFETNFVVSKALEEEMQARAKPLALRGSQFLTHLMNCTFPETMILRFTTKYRSLSPFILWS